MCLDNIGMEGGMEGGKEGRREGGKEGGREGVVQKKRPTIFF